MPREPFDDTEQPQESRFDLNVARERIRNLSQRVNHLYDKLENNEQESKKQREALETRIRVLEDYRLTIDTRVQDLVKWLTVTAAALSGIISLLEHIIFK